MERYINPKKIDFRIPYYPDEEGGDALVSLRAVKQCIDATPTADVVPKSEVEELSGKYEDLKLKYADLQKDHDELIAWGGHIKSTERAEIEKAVAREIFAEIKKALKANFIDCAEDCNFTYYDLCLNYDLAKLKKKYITEGEQYDRIHRRGNYRNT